MLNPLNIKIGIIYTVQHHEIRMLTVLLKLKRVAADKQKLMVSSE